MKLRCIIVDPAADEILVQSCDHREEHPLHHAVMVAIEEIARLQRQSEVPSAPAGEGVSNNRAVQMSASTT